MYKGTVDRVLKVVQDCAFQMLVAVKQAHIFIFFQPFVPEIKRFSKIK